jgi:hypothetical protein
MTAKPLTQGLDQAAAAGSKSATGCQQKLFGIATSAIWKTTTSGGTVSGVGDACHS